MLDDDSRGIKNIAVNFLSNLYSKQCTNVDNQDIDSLILMVSIPKLPENHVRDINKPLLKIEVENFQLKGDKIPGPNGILAFFYQYFWD